MNNQEFEQLRALTNQAESNAKDVNAWRERCNDLEKENHLKDRCIERLEKRLAILKGEQG